MAVMITLPLRIGATNQRELDQLYAHNDSIKQWIIEHTVRGAVSSLCRTADNRWSIQVMFNDPREAMMFRLSWI